MSSDIQIKNNHFETKDSSLEEKSLQTEINKKNTEAFGLHQTFGKDFFQGIFLEVLPQTVELEAKSSSLWSKIYSWWYQPDFKMQAISKPSNVDLLEVDEIQPISAVPVLEESDLIPADLAAALPPSSKKAKLREKLSSHQLSEGLALMSDRTMEQIMFIIYQAQIQLEKESAQAAEKTFSTYQAIQKFKEKALPAIREALEKDARVAGYFKTAQSLTVAASFLCGIAAATASCGALAPAGAFVGAMAGNFAGQGFVAVMAFLGKTGAVVAAGITALTMSGNSYCKYNLNQDKARHEQFKYENQYLTNRLDDAREHLMKISETDNAFKEELLKALKRLMRMFKLVLDK